MIDGLVAGKLFGAPRQGTGKNGSPYTIAAIRAAAGNGEGMIVNVIAFRDSARAALDALSDGDSISASGSLTPKVYQDKQGEYRPSLDMVCQAVLTPYHVNRKRQAMKNDDAPSGALDESHARNDPIGLGRENKE